MVGELNEVQMALEHEFGPPAVQCESQAPPDLLGGDGLARPVLDVKELGMPIGELRGDQVNGDLECAGLLGVRAGDKPAPSSPRNHLHPKCPPQARAT